MPDNSSTPGHHGPTSRTTRAAPHPRDGPMTGTQTAGTWLASAALTLWLGFAALLVTASGQMAPNVLAGLVGVVAVPLSLVAALTLLVEPRTVTARRGAGTSVAAWALYLLPVPGLGDLGHVLTTVAVLALLVAVVSTMRSEGAAGTSR